MGAVNIEFKVMPAVSHLLVFACGHVREEVRTIDPNDPAWREVRLLHGRVLVEAGPKCPDCATDRPVGAWEALTREVAYLRAECKHRGDRLDAASVAIAAAGAALSGAKR